ncbi:MAG: hypothetical protein JWQ60_4350 [Pseudonocardia sp.]|nr:hypothetical protein [Pseudonocardia sp.]
MVITGSTPPGTACRIRNAIKVSRFPASPHSAEAPAKPSRHIV